MKDNFGKYVLVVDGSVPTGAGGAYCTAGGPQRGGYPARGGQGSGGHRLRRHLRGLRRHSLRRSQPDPSAGRSSAIVGDKPIINVSGCPPIPEVITGTLLQFVTTGKVPDLDEHRRPKVFFGNTIHDRCYRRPFYDQGKFAKSFDDEGARNGWCLYELGCKGPTTYNACATLKWNGGTSFPIQSGHGCLGCSEPGFWDKGSFYSALSDRLRGARRARSRRARCSKLAGAAPRRRASRSGAASAGVSRLRQHRQIEQAADNEPKGS